MFFFAAWTGHWAGNEPVRTGMAASADSELMMAPSPRVRANISTVCTGIMTMGAAPVSSEQLQYRSEWSMGMHWAGSVGHLGMHS